MNDKTKPEPFTDRFGKPLNGGDTVVVTGTALDIDPSAFYKATVVRVPDDESAGPHNVLCEAVIRFRVSAVQSYAIARIEHDND